MFGVDNLLQSSARARKLIEWSPLDSSHFLVASSDLRLYHAPENSFGVKSVLDPETSTNDGIRVVSVNSELQNVKCLAWAPFRKEEDLNSLGEVAAGLNNGKVVLTTLSDGVPRLLKEFVPQHARSCNALSWNPYNHSYLAAGLDKVRSDSSLLIWDINRGAEPIPSNPRRFRGSRVLSKVETVVKDLHNSSTSKFSTVPLMETLESIRRPHTELGQSEATCALSWLPSMPSCIAVGTGVKWLRIYDLRLDVTAPRSVIAHSRSVNGVNFDPFNDSRILTFSEDGIIKLWDIRKLVQPVFTVNTGSKNLLEVKWCPTRAGILGSIGKDDSCVKIWDFKDSSIQTDDSPGRSSISFNKPVRTHHTNDHVVSISWHPSNEYKMLSISDSGIVELVQLHESIPITCSVGGAVGWAYGKNMFHTSLTSTDESNEQRDISAIMRQRAELGYSMDIEYNYKLAAKGCLTVPIKRLYEWMRSIESISPRFLGFLSILKNENEVGVDTSQTKMQNIKDFPPVYRNPRRQLVLQICGWAVNESLIEDVISRLEDRKLFNRATAIAIFHFQVQRGVQCLHKGAKQLDDPRYQFIAMALAGFSSNADQAKVWKETCGSVIDQLNDPYLKSCFSFLCNAEDSYFPILYDDNLRLLDRIAFACTFLDDPTLLHYMEEEMEKAIRAGNIEGIPLTGLSLDGVSLFQNYIDNTTDIQTASLAMSRVVPSRFLDSTVSQWTQLYKQLLDSWQLWHQRALLDISMAEGPLSEAKPAQVFARCTFCNNTLELGLNNSKVNDRSRFIRTARSHPVEKVKISGCPSCKKPLPHCSVCMLPLHCAASKAGGQADHKSKPSRKFDEWFTWCQNCKHGGHSNHLLDWFLNHTQCPVTDCQCNCSSL